MHTSVMNFGREVLTWNVCHDKRILEVGSYNVNGSLRPVAMEHYPYQYIGVDCRPGPGVDVIGYAEDLDRLLPEQFFDIIICTEMLEHADEWWTALRAMVAMLVPRGYLLLTTRSPGFPLHNDPVDYWRFTYDHLTVDLNGLGMTVLYPSRQDEESTPGVLMWARQTSWASPAYRPYPPLAMPNGITWTDNDTNTH